MLSVLAGIGGTGDPILLVRLLHPNPGVDEGSGFKGSLLRSIKNSGSGGLVAGCRALCTFRILKPFSVSSVVMVSILVVGWRYLIATRNGLSSFSW